ncbi:MAG: transposase [Candidatus Heimdallarchaeota archaeon]
MKPKEDYLKTFFAEKVIRNFIPKNLSLLKINKVIDWNPIREILLTDNNDEPVIYSTVGRPAWDPLVIFKMLFLQNYHPASDIKVEERAMTDLSYRLFLKIPFPSPVPDATTLVRYRKKWGENKIRQVMVEINKQIQAAGYLKIQEGVVGDTTHQVANISKPTARELLLRVFQKFLQEWNDFNQLYLPNNSKDMVKNLLLAFDVFKATEESNRRLPTSNRRERFANVVNHITSVLDSFYAFHQSNFALIGNMEEWIFVFNRYNLLRKIIAENTKLKENEFLQTKGNRKIISDVDVDARSGQKSKSNKYTGYKIATIRTTSGFNINIQTVSGEVSDMNLAPEMLGRVITDYNIVPDQAAFDKGFDSTENRVKMHSMGIQPGIEFRNFGNSRNTKLFTNTDFKVNLKEMQAICPAGKVSSSHYLLHNPERYMFKFSKDQCSSCGLYNQCTTNKTGRTIQISYYKELIDKDKEYLNSKEYEKLRKTRWGQEADYGICKRTLNLAKTKYHGIKKVAMANCLIFLVFNVKRFVKQVTKTRKLGGIRGHSVC